jgi:cytochrome P450
MPRAVGHDASTVPAAPDALSRRAELLYDPRSAAFQADPFAVYESLRREAPVFWSDRMEGWIVSRFEDVVGVLMDNKRYTARGSIGIEPFTEFAPEVQAVFDTGYERFPGMIELDPPDHTRYRSLVNKAFTPRRVAALEPQIQAITDDLIDGFAADGRIDFIRRFAFPLPMTVICEMLAVPSADMDHVQELADGFRTLEAGTVGKLPIDEQLDVARAFVAFQHYAAGLVEMRRREPAEDLLGTLIVAELDDGRALTTEELVSMITHFLFAGQETAARLLGTLMYRLLSVRERWERLVADPSLANAVSEEGLRLEPPVIYHHRETREAVTLAGVDIPAGDTLHLLFASANHDEAAFADPEAFAPERDGLSRHLGFGRGVHFCVGAPVARREMRIALETLARRLPAIELTPGPSPEPEDHVMLRGLKRLDVRWDPATVEPRA